jgi:Zn-dependent peptidase ImmA (M78 family)
VTADYNPWSHVGRFTDVLVVLDELEHADAYWEPDERVILIDRRLSQAERRCRLAHELAHLEAGDEHCADGPDGERLAARQELRADAAAAERLIDLDALADALAWALDPQEVAEALHVDTRTVRARVRNLTEHEKSYIERRVAAREGAA